MNRRRLTTVLASPRLTALLLVVLIAMSLLNVVVPQRTHLGPEQYEQFRRSLPVLAAVLRPLGLDAVFGGWLMAAVCGALLLNLALCTLRRLRVRATPPRAAVGGGPARISLGPGRDAGVLDRVSATASAEGWRILARTPDTLVASKGSHGFWGSMLLHAGIAIVIVGGALSVLGGFNGQILLAEGQSVTDAPPAYLTIDRLPRVGRAYSGATISLDRVAVRYEGGDVVDATARMKASAGGRDMARDVRVNFPLEVAGKSYLLQENGYAVALGVRQPGGEERAVAVNLAQSTPSGWADTSVLTVAGGRELRLEMTATARPVADPALPLARKLDAADPRLIVSASTAGGRWAGVLKPGEEVRLPDGTVLRFAGTRLWARFMVRGQPFRWIVYLGFWACVAGALWRFAFPERRLDVVLRGGPGGPELAAAWRARPWAPQGRYGSGAAVAMVERAAAEGMEEREWA